MKPNIDGGNIRGVAPISHAAAASAKPGIPIIFRWELSAGANADNDITLEFPIRVIDVWAHLNGAGVASSVMTVKNGSTAISSALDTSGSDKAVLRTTTIDDAQRDIASGGTLRATSSGGASAPAQTVYVLAMRMG